MDAETREMDERNRNVHRTIKTQLIELSVDQARSGFQIILPRVCAFLRHIDISVPHEENTTPDCIKIARYKATYKLYVTLCKKKEKNL